jgi:hypothetical protein
MGVTNALPLVTVHHGARTNPHLSTLPMNPHRGLDCGTDDGVRLTRDTIQFPLRYTKSFNNVTTYTTTYIQEQP